MTTGTSIVSSNLAIGTASVFVIAAAAIGLVADGGAVERGARDGPGPAAAWRLRGPVVVFEPLRSVNTSLAGGAHALLAGL